MIINTIKSKYITISVVSIVLDYILLHALAFTLMELFSPQSAILLSASLAHLLASTINFYLLKNYVFADNQQTLIKSFFKYMILLVVANIATTTIIYFSLPLLENNLFYAKTLSVVVLFPLIYIINKKIIFNQ